MAGAMLFPLIWWS